MGVLCPIYHIEKYQSEQSYTYTFSSSASDYKKVYLFVKSYGSCADFLCKGLVVGDHCHAHVSLFGYIKQDIPDLSLGDNV